MLVLRGQPGVGKIALLDYAIDSAQEFSVARSAGIESEMELAFAGVHQLCAPLLDRLDRLPDPQREAVELGGSETTRFLVALATLGLLSDAAEEQRRERRRPDLREVLAREGPRRRFLASGRRATRGAWSQRQDCESLCSVPAESRTPSSMGPRGFGAEHRPARSKRVEVTNR